MEVVKGNKLIYLYRCLADAATATGTTLAFTTGNERSISKDSDSTETKDGVINTPGATEQTISADSILAKGDTLLAKLEDALKNGETIEIWEANLDEPAEGANKFKGMYFQGVLTELSYSSNADGNVEVSLEWAINGNGERGDVTVSVEQQEIAAYVFRDTVKVAGA